MRSWATAAVNDALATALKRQPAIPGNLINVAGRQRTRLPEMVQEAALYSLFPSMGTTEQAIATRSWSRRRKTIFEDAHFGLLHGNQLLEHISNACACRRGGTSGRTSTQSDTIVSRQ